MKGKRLWVILAVLAVLVVGSIAVIAMQDKDNDTGKNTEQDSQKDTEKDTENDADEVETVTLTDEGLAGDLLIDFTKGADSSVVFESDGWSNGDVFNVVWTKDNVKYEDGKMSLGITKENKNVWLNDQEVTLPYTAGEARTQNYFGYGDYEVKMKPSANAGTASTFFVCTGNYDTKYVLDENGNVVYNEDGSIKAEPNPHDEIDIEFLGKDTTKVQFNFFVNGVGGNEYMYDLGFDASEEYHEYGFRWTEDSITWFVDNQPVYKVTTDTSVKESENVRIVETIPSTPGRLLMNYWCGNEDAEGWMGKYEGNVKDNGCEYLWVQTSTKGNPLNPTINQAEGQEAVPEVNWSSVSAVKPTFESTEKYTVTNKGTTSNIKYSSVGGSDYINVEMDITEAAKEKNVLHLTLKNNAKKDVQVRVNVVDAELLAKGAKNSSTNKAATMNGTVVNTDLEWGGSFFDIKAGETVEAVISFTGNVEKLQLMIDSSRNDTNTYAGDVTVSDIKFAKVGEIIDENTVGKYKINPIEKVMKATANVNVRSLPAKEGEKIGSLKKGEVVLVTGQCTQTKWYRINYKDGAVGYVSPEYLVDAPNEQPAPSADNSIYINGKEYFFEGDGYTLKSNKDSELNVTYSKIEGATYKNIATGLTGLSADLNKLTLKVTNNGTKEVLIRIDVNSQTQVSENTKACNLYATQDGIEVYTDFDWGGSQFNIAAGKTSTLEIYFDAAKKVDSLIIFIDSCNYLDDGKGVMYSGNITFSEVAFGQGTVPTEPEEPVVPDTPGTGDEGETTRVEADLTFNSDTYTITKDETNKIWNVTYTDVPGAGYKVISAGIEAIDSGLNRYTVKVSNNGSANAKVRIDILDAEGKAINLSSTQDGEETFTDLTYGGSMFELAAGQTSVLEVVFDAAKGAETVNIFFDSHTWGDTNTYSGDLTLSEMAFIGVVSEEVSGPIVSPGEDEGDQGGEGDEGGEGTTPEYPVSGDLTTTINGTEVTFDGNTSDGYGVNADDENNEVDVIYTNIVGSSYKNLTANIESIAANNNIFKVEITNNGTETVKIRIDLKNAAGDMCNTSAIQTGVSATTDSSNGTQIEIVANATAVVEITYDASMQPTLLYFFFDSWKWDDNTSHAGSVTLSGMEFKTATETPDDGEGDQGGTQEPETPTYDKLTFWASEGYTVSTTEATDNVNIKYNGAGNTYGPVGANVAEIANENNTFSFKITNNGSETATVRVDIQGTAKVGNTDAINVSATADGNAVYTDTEWGGSKIEVAAGATVTVVVTYDTTTDKGAATNVLFYTGSQLGTVDNVTSDVTLSEFKFYTVETE